MFGKKVKYLIYRENKLRGMVYQGKQGSFVIKISSL